MSKNGSSASNGPWAPVFYVLFGGFLWLLAATLWQGGWRLFGSFWLIYLQVAIALVCLASLVSALRKGPIEFLATVGVFLTLAWIFVSGSFGSWTTLLLDLACAVVAWGLTVLVMKGLTRLRQPGVKSWKEVSPPHAKNLDALVWVLLAWILVSALTVVLERPLPTDPARFAALGPQRSIVPEEAERWKELRIGLALSGGGYRAAIFHAGVLEALEELGVRIGNLSTVSGGSIIGAYYSVGGDPRDFVKALRHRRLDLKRQLLLIHNAVRLPFPAKVPKLGVALLPGYRFDRLDVQRNLLDRMLFQNAQLKAGIDGPEPDVGQPRLMIAATDLTYGFQVGLLPDGMLKLGEGVAEQNVYRNEVFEPEEHWSLAQRVTVSGAFPLAFPARPFRVRVKSSGATGRGVRELLLVDGGIRDNLGADLLRAADRSAELAAADLEPNDEFITADWDLDAMLVSNGGAVLGVQEDPGNMLTALPRAFEIAAIEAELPHSPKQPCERLRFLPTLTTFSPSRTMLSPDTQFNLKNDSDKRAALDREWSLQFDPVRYPEKVLRRIVEHLPEADRAQAGETLDAFLRGWSMHRTFDPRWSRSLKLAREPGACDSATGTASSAAQDLLPGSCEAAALRALVQQGIMLDLDIFRTASTLDDRLPQATINSLERLGRMLVYYRWHYLKRNLDQAVQCRAEGGAMGLSPER